MDIYTQLPFSREQIIRTFEHIATEINDSYKNDQYDKLEKFTFIFIENIKCYIEDQKIIAFKELTSIIDTLPKFIKVRIIECTYTQMPNPCFLPTNQFYSTNSLWSGPLEPDLAVILSQIPSPSAPLQDFDYQTNPAFKELRCKQKEPKNDIPAVKRPREEKHTTDDQPSLKRLKDEGVTNPKKCVIVAKPSIKSIKNESKVHPKQDNSENNPKPSLKRPREEYIAEIKPFNEVDINIDIKFDEALDDITLQMENLKLPGSLENKEKFIDVYDDNEYFEYCRQSVE